MFLKIVSKTLTTLALIFLGTECAQAAAIEIVDGANLYINVYPNDQGTAYERADTPQRFQLTFDMSLRMNPPHKVTAWNIANRHSIAGIPGFGTSFEGLSTYTYPEGSRATSIRERVIYTYFGPQFRGPAVQACNAALDSVPSSLRRRTLSLGARAYLTFTPTARFNTTASDDYIRVEGSPKRFTINCLPWRGDRTEDVERRDAATHGPAEFQSVFIRTQAVPRRAGQPCQLFIRVLARNSHQYQTMNYVLFGPRNRSHYQGSIRTDRYGRGHSDHYHTLENQSGLNQGTFYITTQEISSNRTPFNVNCSTPPQMKSAAPTLKIKPKQRINPHMKKVPHHPQLKRLPDLNKK